MLITTDNSPSSKPYSKLKMLTAVASVAVLLAAGFGLYWKLSQKSGPFTKNTYTNTNFVLYYPTVLPPNYYKVKDSETIFDGILFFSLTDGKQVIKISEQKLPANPPNLDGLLEFKKVQTIAGKAVIGKEGLYAKGVLVSTTTLISVSGDKNVPDDVVGAVIQSLQSVSRP